MHTYLFSRVLLVEYLIYCQGRNVFILQPDRTVPRKIALYLITQHGNIYKAARDYDQERAWAVME